MTATDSTGAAATLFLDRSGAVARVDDALGHSMGVSFSDDFNLTRFNDAIGQAYSFGYDTGAT